MPSPGRWAATPGRSCIRRPLFIVSAVLIVIFLLMAAVPRLFTAIDPRDCALARSRLPPSSSAWFGYDSLGCDVYANTIYGARSSIIVGLATTIMVVLIGGFLGTMGGFYAGKTDAILSRIADIFFGIPFLLGALLVLTSFPSGPETPAWQTISKVVATLPSWAGRVPPADALQRVSGEHQRLRRGRAVPWGRRVNRLMRRHVVPNSIARSSWSPPSRWAASSWLRPR